MWTQLVEKLRALTAIDRQFQAFGANCHRYQLFPCLSEATIQEAESRIGVQLPSALRCFYSEIGDGIAGPNYGLSRVAELKGYRPNEHYPGIEEIRRLARSTGEPPDERGYFEVPHDELTGLLSIIHEGCGHETCIVSIGSLAGNVIYVSADGHVVETTKNLLDVYAKWLDQELDMFQSVFVMMNAGLSFEQIDKNMRCRFDDHRAGGRIASIANKTKPASLFGEGNTRIYHAASQNPWYEAILKEWQRTTL
jgi:hypothetical protein